MWRWARGPGTAGAWAARPAIPGPEAVRWSRDSVPAVPATAGAIPATVGAIPATAAALGSVDRRVTPG